MVSDASHLSEPVVHLEQAAHPLLLENLSKDPPAVHKAVKAKKSSQSSSGKRKHKKTKGTKDTKKQASSLPPPSLVANEPESELTRLEELNSSQELPLPEEAPAPASTSSTRKLSLLSKRRKSNKSSSACSPVAAEPARSEFSEPDQQTSAPVECEEVTVTPAKSQSQSLPESSSLLSTKEQGKKKKRSSRSSSRSRSGKRRVETDAGEKKKRKTRKSKRSGSKEEKKRRRKRAATEEDDSEDYDDQFFLEVSDTNDFTCLTEADIIAEQSKEIQEVAEILSVRESAAISLLKHFKWSREQLMASYFDDPTRALEAAGVPLDAVEALPAGAAPLLESVEKLPSPVAKDELEEEECTICSFDVTPDEMYALKSCGHSFCEDCWSTYLSLQINEGQSFINCAHMDCKALVSEEEVRALVAPEIYQKYCTFFMHSFVNNNANIKWCPAPGCGNAVTSDMVNGKTVTCRCLYRFCFRCSEEAHQPASCGHVRMWKKKCQDESETNNWIAANTQDCPKCGLPTEKNGGCNHMTCRQCKHEYCWVCSKDWKGHNDFYSCNRYSKSKEEKKSSKKNSRKEREQQRLEMRKALQRYLHYQSRFDNHARSSELEATQEKALKVMQKMEETEATGAEVYFIQQATEKLREARSVLKYSYVLRYYMEDEDTRSALLEYLQEDLEKSAERLSELLGSPMKNKMEIVNLTSITETRLRNMVDAVDCS